jgi:predicted RNA-binding Zn ribbon-like protein
MNDKPVNDFSGVSKFLGALPFILTLPLTGDRPCLNFVNTIDWRLNLQKCRDALETYSDLLAFALRLNIISIPTYTALSENAAAAPLLAARSIMDARAFRDALTSIIDDITNPQLQSQREQLKPEAIAIFEAARRKAHESEYLLWSAGRLVLCFHPEEEGLDLPWLTLVRDAEDLFRSPLASRVRVCAAEGCGWAFLDLSKNGTRRWCSMKLCGNREKATRYRAKSNLV